MLTWEIVILALRLSSRTISVQQALIRASLSVSVFTTLGSRSSSMPEQRKKKVLVRSLIDPSELQSHTLHRSLGLELQEWLVLICSPIKPICLMLLSSVHLPESWTSVPSLTTCDRRRRLLWRPSFLHTYRQRTTRRRMA